MTNPPPNSDILEAAPIVGTRSFLPEGTDQDKLELVRQLSEYCAQLGIPLGESSGPGQLALRHDPRLTRQRPHLLAIDDALTALHGTPNMRLMIFTPPQVGKSWRVSRWFPFWWLTMRPTDRILLSSYAASLAVTHGSACRDFVKLYGSQYGLRLSTSQSTKADWQVTAGGGMRSQGIAGGTTGQSMDLGIIDDPFKDRAEADSPPMREKVWNWYSSTWSSRKSPEFREVIVMCMTGDTSVLMADGLEKPLRDVRAGDVVATYEAGELTTSTVRNWANQGSDSIYRITMKSGREVRANARHPFLTVDESGHEAWTRTSSIEPGNAILAIGESGGERHAPQRNATNPHDARDCVPRTTTNSGGPRATVGGPPTRTARRGCSTATESPRNSTTSLSSNRTGCAQSADNPPTTPTPAPIGPENYASTTITKPVTSAGYSATIATSPWDMESRRPSCAPPLTTYSVTPDEVVAVEPCGTEDVFDVQIDRTENFIANGLVSHNTRWHQDDLAGRLLKQDGRVEEGGEWHVVHMPAIAMPEDHDNGVYSDPLDREPGEPLTHPRIAPDDTTALLRHWQRQKTTATARDWNALYLGLPYDAAGALLKKDQVKAATLPRPDVFARIVVGVDPSGGGRDTAGIVVTALDFQGHVWWLADRTARMTSPQWSLEVCKVAAEFDATQVVVETNFGGDQATTLIAQAWELAVQRGEVSGLCPLVTAVTARVSKVLRAEPIAQAILTGRAFFDEAADLKQFQHEWQQWEPGSNWSPGALDAGVHAATKLLPALPRGAAGTNPADTRRDNVSSQPVGPAAFRINRSA